MFKQFKMANKLILLGLIVIMVIIIFWGIAKLKREGGY